MVFEIDGVFYNFKQIRGESNINFNIRILKIINYIKHKQDCNYVTIMKEFNDNVYNCKY